MTTSCTATDTPVSFTDLQAAVSDAVADGQSGEPVSVRLHWDVEESVALPSAMFAAALLADAALTLTDTRWTVRQDPRGRLLNVLGVDDRGRTALLSVSRAATDRLSVTVFGNHGVARIEQVRLADGVPRETDISDERDWMTSLRNAVQAAVSG